MISVVSRTTACPCVTRWRDRSQWRMDAMKIISPGNIEATEPWFVRMRWRCKACNCVFQPDASDTVERLSNGQETATIRVWDSQRPGEPDSYASTACPTCGNNVVVNIDMAAAHARG